MGAQLPTLGTVTLLSRHPTTGTRADADTSPLGR